MSNNLKSVTDTSDWEIEILSFEVGNFAHPKDKSLISGRRWFILLRHATAEYGLKLLTPTDEYPNATEEELRQKVQEFARSMLASGWRPDGYSGPNPVAELKRMAKELIENSKKNSQD